uniref:Uncharacterized protein n=1 Tax=Oryza rufipogon TaxID=4529 RepID=A0A0E0PGS2_ORYRU
MEKDKGLVSNLMHGVAGGGHAYPYPPQQGYYPPPPTAYPPPAGYAAPYQAMVEEGTWLRCLERVQPSPPRRTVHTSFLPMAAMEATVTVTAVTMAVAASLAAITMATAAITANTMEAITDTTTTMAASMAVITDTTATTAASMAVTTAVTMVATINTALSFSPCLLNNDTQGSPAVGMSGSLPAERHRSGVAEAMCRLASGVRMVVLDWEIYHGGRVVRVPSESLAQCFIGPTVATVSGVWKKLLRSDEESTLMVLTQRMKEMVARLKPTRTGVG